MFGLLGAIVVVVVLVIWASLRETNKTAKLWNDGNCVCGTGKLRFKEEVDYPEVGKFCVYACTSCENTEAFTRRLDREDLE